MFSGIFYHFPVSGFPPSHPFSVFSNPQLCRRHEVDRTGAVDGRAGGPTGQQQQRGERLPAAIRRTGVRDRHEDRGQPFRIRRPRPILVVRVRRQRHGRGAVQRDRRVSGGHYVHL